MQQGVGDLSINIELELFRRRIADANRLRALVSAKPVQFAFRQIALSSNAVHDLHLVGAAGGGPQQPVAPGTGFVKVTGVH